MGGPLLVQQARQSVWEGKQIILFPGLLGSFWSSVPCIVFFSYRSKTPLVVWLQYCKGEACIASWISTERTCYVCVCARVCIFLYFFFSTRRMLKLTLVIVEHGRAKGRSRGMRRGEQGTALNRSTMPVPARALRATGTLFSAIIPPFCHVPYGSATHLD